MSHQRLIFRAVCSATVSLLAHSALFTAGAQAQPIPLTQGQFANIRVTALGPNVVKIDWNPLASANQYFVQRNGQQISPDIQSNPTTAAPLSFTDNGAPANSTVSYTVIALVRQTIYSTDGTAHAGEFPHPSNTVTVVTPALPPPPASTTSTITTTTTVPTSTIPPWAGQCKRSSGSVIAVACTRDGQFKVELEVWIRNLLVYSSAGSELRFYGWSAHTGVFGLGGPGWAEFLVPPSGPVSMHNAFGSVVAPSGSSVANAVQTCGQGGQGLVEIALLSAIRYQCFLWSAGASVSLDAGANNGLPNVGTASPGTLPQLTVQSVRANATVSVNGESVSVGLAKIP
jgi:hypothetical protein